MSKDEALDGETSGDVQQAIPSSTLPVQNNTPIVMRGRADERRTA